MEVLSTDTNYLTTVTQKVLLKELDSQAMKCHHINQYFLGQAPLPVLPPEASPQHRRLAELSRQPWARLAIMTLAAHLKVSRYNLPDGRKHPGWQTWRDSGMETKEPMLYQAALAFGHAYVVSEMTDNGVRFAYVSPLDCAVFFEDPLNDEEPILALRRKFDFAGKAYYWVYDTIYRYTFRKVGRGWVEIEDERIEHGSTRVPVQRYVKSFNPLTGAVMGDIEPLIDTIKMAWQAEYTLQATLKWNSFKTTVFTGIDIPAPRFDAEGNQLNDPAREMKLQIAREQILAFKKSDGGPDEEKVGVQQLQETSLYPIMQARDAAIGILIAHFQASPTLVAAKRENISNETLITEETPARRKVENLQESWGRAHERLFQIAAEMDPNDEATVEPEARIQWKTVDQATIAQMTDALLKIVQGLGVPKEWAWEHLPLNLSPEDIERMKAMLDEEEQRARERLDSAFSDAKASLNLTAEEEAEFAEVA